MHDARPTMYTARTTSNNARTTLHEPQNLAHSAVVKAVFDMGELRTLTPMQRRENPAFPRYFDAIWKELELHE